MFLKMVGEYILWYEGKYSYFIYICELFIVCYIICIIEGFFIGSCVRVMFNGVFKMWV